MYEGCFVYYNFAEVGFVGSPISLVKICLASIFKLIERFRIRVRVIYELKTIIIYLVSLYLRINSFSFIKKKLVI